MNGQQSGGHTPGPWRIIAREVLEDGSAYPRHVVGGERGLLVTPLESGIQADIAIKQPGTHWDTTRQQEANARLIAAAPHLLAVARYARAVLPDEAWADDTKQMLDAAIAKATGSQP